MLLKPPSHSSIWDMDVLEEVLKYISSVKQTVCCSKLTSSALLKQEFLQTLRERMTHRWCLKNMVGLAKQQCQASPLPVVGGWSNVHSIDMEQHPGIYCQHVRPSDIWYSTQMSAIFMKSICARKADQTREPYVPSLVCYVRTRHCNPEIK